MKHRHTIRIKAEVPEDDCAIDSVGTSGQGPTGMNGNVMTCSALPLPGTPTCGGSPRPRTGREHPLRKDYPVQSDLGDREWPGYTDVVATAKKNKRPRGPINADRNKGNEHARTYQHGSAASGHPWGAAAGADLDGETVKCTPHVGYLHRGIEKLAVDRSYTAAPLTDRLDYISNMTNNVGYCLAVEGLFRHRGAGAGQIYPDHHVGDDEDQQSHRLACHPCPGPGVMTVFLYSFRGAGTAPWTS